MGMDNLEREIEDAENEINRLRSEKEELKAKLSETVIHLAARNSEIKELQAKLDKAIDALRFLTKSDGPIGNYARTTLEEIG